VIAKHKQYCATVQKDIAQNCNFLLSTSTNDVQHGLHDGNSDTHVYDFTNYNDVDCSSNNEEDSIENENLSDNDDEHTSSLSLGELQIINNQEDDSTTASDDNNDDDDNGEYSHSNSSMSCDDPLPNYDNPLFSQQQPHLSLAYQLQVHLNSLFDKNKASVQTYDKMVKLFNAYISSSQFSKHTLLRPRKIFISESEKLFSIEALKPINGTVKMTDNTLVTVPVFDAKAMILSILHDPILMKEENFA